MNNNIKDFVEQALKEYPETRNNDFLLCIHVYLKMGFAHRIPLGVVIHYENIEFAPAFESITRARREIQNDENRLKPSEEVQEKRERHRQEIHAYYSTKQSRLNTFPNSWMLP